MSATMQTVELEPTQNATSDEYYMPADETCHCCDADSPQLVEINAGKGQRRWVFACDDCLSTWEDAPAGIYDPVVLARLPTNE